MLETKYKYYENEAMFHGFIPRIMGTRFDILLIHSDINRLNRLWTTITNELERLDKLLNRFDPHSEVSIVNSHSSRNNMAISKELESILQLCLYYYERTFHLFDITLKDFSGIQFHESERISFISPATTLDFGGFAKGYALKQIRRLLEQENIDHAFINFGNSSILGLGHHPYGDCWKVSLLNPYNQALLKEFDLQDAALSTSGNTLQYTGHIVNPLTERWNEKRQASSVLSIDPLEAEILSTVWMIANEQEQKQISENFNLIEATLYDL